jgi:hypothetical protein
MADQHLSLLPMQIQVGDRFTDEAGEWEILVHPSVLHGGKTVHARAQRPGDPASARDVTWPAHERIDIVRKPALTALPATKPPRRPPARRRKPGGR